jgi:hypothetical protein
MTECAWEKIDNFNNYNEFKRFVLWMDEQIKKGLAKEIPVLYQYSGSDLR